MKKLIPVLLFAFCLTGIAEESATNETTRPKRPKEKKTAQVQKSTPAPVSLDTLKKEAVSGSIQDRDNYFNQYAKSVQNIYDTFKNGKGVVSSYRSKKEAPSIKSNYALELESFFNKTTKTPVSPRNGAFIKTKEGIHAEIDKIYSTDTDAVFIKDGIQQKRVLVSDLDLPSQQLARDLIIDKLFDIRFEISARELNVKTREAVTGSFKGATETTTYAETAYGITLENKSDLPIDNLIVEYQIFFKQTLAGTPEGMDEYYRFAGHSIVKAVPAKDKFTITANPPAIMESNLKGASGGNRDYFIRYSKGLNQNSSGRIQGVWVRVHRITPFGRLTRELKEGVYPDDAEWDAIAMLKAGASPAK